MPMNLMSIINSQVRSAPLKMLSITGYIFKTSKNKEPLVCSSEIESEKLLSTLKLQKYKNILILEN